MLAEEVTRRKRAEESVRQLSAHLLRIQDEERRRIARELHDGTVQTLSALIINLAILESRLVHLRDEGAAKSLLESQSLAEQAAKELRSVSHMLRAPDIETVGLSAAIQSYVPRFSRMSGVHVDLDLPSSGRLPRDIEKALFRITQESLNNVHRRSAGAAAKVRVALQEAHVVLEVADHGGAASVETTDKLNRILDRFGVGLAGMEERVRQLGGRLEISSNPQGTTVRAVVPLPQQYGVRAIGSQLP